MDKDNWEMRDTSPEGTKRIQLWLPVSLTWDILPTHYHLCFSFSWMPPLQWNKPGQRFKSKLTRLEILENLEKTELCHLKTNFLPFTHCCVVCSRAFPTSPADLGGMPRPVFVPGWVLSICRNLPPSVQPAPADSLHRSCDNQDLRELSTLLFPPMLFLLLKFCDPWQSSSVTAHNLLLTSPKCSTAN